MWSNEVPCSKEMKRIALSSVALETWLLFAHKKNLQFSEAINWTNEMDTEWKRNTCNHKIYLFFIIITEFWQIFNHNIVFCPILCSFLCRNSKIDYVKCDTAQHPVCRFTFCENPLNRTEPMCIYILLIFIAVKLVENCLHALCISL